jgi:hypothetical protein
MMFKFDNYIAILNTFLEQRKTVPFKWGESDCCMFACDGLLALTGIDVAKDYRGKYDTASGSKKSLGEAGLNKIITDLMNDLDVKEINKNFAKRGDLVLIDTPRGDALALIDMRGNVTGQGEFKLVTYKLDCVIKAWGIK